MINAKTTNTAFNDKKRNYPDINSWYGSYLTEAGFGSSAFKNSNSYKISAKADLESTKYKKPTL